MRIVYFVNGLGLGGAERQLYELIKGLCGRSLVAAGDIRVVSFRSGGQLEEAFTALGVPVLVVPRRGSFSPTAFFAVKRILTGFRPDVIHSWTALSALYALFPARSLGVPFIDGSIRDAAAPPRFSRLWCLNRISFRSAAAIVGNSRAGLANRGADPAKSVCIVNGFDFARLNGLPPPDVVAATWQIARPLVVGMVANFTPNKDHPTFLHAARMLLAERNDVCFVCVGDGPELAAAREAAAGLPPLAVRFLGRQTPIEPIANLFDVAVLTTHPTRHAEGISNALMEVMALGKPVVATRGGGTDELVGDGSDGLLVDPAAPGQLAEALRRLLDDADLRARLGRAAREKIRSCFDFSVMVDSFFSLYGRLAGNSL
jgi:glycosyltransferase involved in cell wall biosynthesis